MPRAQYVAALVVLGVSGLAGGAIIDWAQGEPAGAQGQGSGILEAREFRMVDDQGRVRGVLRTDGPGPRLDLCDEDGTVRVRLGRSTTVKQWAISLYGADPTSRVTAAVTDDNQCGLLIADTGGGHRIRIGGDNQEEYGLELLGPEGAAVWTSGAIEWPEIAIEPREPHAHGVVRPKEIEVVVRKPGLYIPIRGEMRIDTDRR